MFLDYDEKFYKKAFRTTLNEVIFERVDAHQLYQRWLLLNGSGPVEQERSLRDLVPPGSWHWAELEKYLSQVGRKETAIQKNRYIYDRMLRKSYRYYRKSQLLNKKLLKSRTYWRLKSGDDCTRSAKANNLIVKHYQDPFWNECFPCASPLCNCKVFAESERSLKNAGLVVS